MYGGLLNCWIQHIHVEYIVSIPYDGPLAYETVPPEGDDDSMAGARASEVTANDSAAGDDGLSAEDDVLRSGDDCAAGDFVTCILRGSAGDLCISLHCRRTVSMYSLLM